MSLKKEEKKLPNKSETPSNKDDKSWRFFDPLASPSGDEELLKLEALLEEKAKKANQGLVIEQKPDIIASTEERKPRLKQQPKDIESLISNNLMKLRSLSPNSKGQKTVDGSNLTYDRLDVAKSVLVELRGRPSKKKPPAPPPPPPPKPPSPKMRKKVAPSRPPAPKIDLIDVNFVQEEPLYAKVKKEQSFRPDR